MHFVIEFVGSYADFCTSHLTLTAHGFLNLLCMNYYKYIFLNYYHIIIRVCRSWSYNAVDIWLWCEHKKCI